MSKPAPVIEPLTYAEALHLYTALTRTLEGIQQIEPAARRAAGMSDKMLRDAISAAAKVERYMVECGQ